MARKLREQESSTGEINSIDDKATKHQRLQYNVVCFVKKKKKELKFNQVSPINRTCTSIKTATKGERKMEFRYLITQNEDNSWDVTFYIDHTAYVGPTDCKSYIEALELIQLLQFPLTEFDQDCLRIADEMNLRSAA